MMLVEWLNRRNTVMVLLFMLSTITQLAGCAGSPDAGNSSGGPVTTLTETNLNDWSSSQLKACGDPVEWTDVRILWTVNEDSSRKVSANKIHNEIQTYEREGWTGYWVSSSRARAVIKAQKAFAAQGCDLLIIGDIISIPKKGYIDHYPSGGSTDVLLVRWERDDLREY